MIVIEPLITLFVGFAYSHEKITQYTVILCVHEVRLGYGKSVKIIVVF